MHVRHLLLSRTSLSFNILLLFLFNRVLTGINSLISLSSSLNHTYTLFSGLFFGELESSKLGTFFICLHSSFSSDLFSLQLVEIDSWHGNAEPAGGLRPLHCRAFDQNFLIETDLRDFFSYVHTNISWLQIYFKSICCQELRYLHIEDKFGAIWCWVEIELVATLVTLSDMTILGVDSGRARLCFSYQIIIFLEH